MDALSDDVAGGRFRGFSAFWGRFLATRAVSTQTLGSPIFLGVVTRFASSDDDSAHFECEHHVPRSN